MWAQWIHAITYRHNMQSNANSMSIVHSVIQPACSRMLRLLKGDEMQEHLFFQAMASRETGVRVSAQMTDIDGFGTDTRETFTAIEPECAPHECK